MKRSFESLSGNRRLVAATLAAVIIIGVQFIQQLGNTVLHIGTYLVRGAGMGSAEWVLPGLFWVLLSAVLPFALGVFLCLWLLAPVAAELPLMSVIWRSLLAVLAGTLVLFVAVLLGSLFSGFDESAGLVFGWAYGAMATAASNIGEVLIQSTFSAGNMAITVAPLAVLACVMSWLWLRAQPLNAVTEDDTVEV